MTYDEAINLLGIEQSKDMAMETIRTLFNWIDEHDDPEAACIPLALFGVCKTRRLFVVITNQDERQDHWSSEPLICNAMFLSPDEPLSVQRVEEREH